MKRNQKLVFISIYCALALVLDYIKSFIPFLNMPLGGSINIALIPIVISSFHLGIKDGAITGFMWWLVSSILGLNPYYISIVQYLLDYVVPSVIMGLSSIFYSNKKLIQMEAGISLMMIIRTLVIICSGALYWEEGIDGIYAWSASATYNIPYSFATLIMLLIVMPILSKSLRKYML